MSDAEAEALCPLGCGRPRHEFVAVAALEIGLDACPGVTAINAIRWRRDHVNTLAQQGLLTGEIAAALGVSTWTVRRDRAATGCRAPIGGRRGIRLGEEIAARIDSVDRLTRQGLSSATIADRLGVTQRTVVRDRATLRAARQSRAVQP